MSEEEPVIRSEDIEAVRDELAAVMIACITEDGLPARSVFYGCVSALLELCRASKTVEGQNRAIEMAVAILTEALPTESLSTPEET